MNTFSTVATWAGVLILVTYVLSAVLKHATSVSGAVKDNFLTRRPSKIVVTPPEAVGSFNRRPLPVQTRNPELAFARPTSPDEWRTGEQDPVHLPAIVHEQPSWEDESPSDVWGTREHLPAPMREDRTLEHGTLALDVLEELRREKDQYSWNAPSLHLPARDRFKIDPAVGIVRIPGTYVGDPSDYDIRQFMQREEDLMKNRHRAPESATGEHETVEAPAGPDTDPDTDITEELTEEEQEARFFADPLNLSIPVPPRLAAQAGNPLAEKILDELIESGTLTGVGANMDFGFEGWGYLDPADTVPGKLTKARLERELLAGADADADLELVNA